MSVPVKRIVLFGDNVGIPQLLKHLPVGQVVGIVGAGIRPQYFEELGKISHDLSVPFLIQPRVDDVEQYEVFVRSFLGLDANCLLCSSYSMLIRPEILSCVSGYAFNLHYSLLPRHRGPNPLQWALICGDDTFGATVHKMGNGFDDGPVVDQVSVPIHAEDTWLTLFEKIKEPACQLLSITLPRVLEGGFEFTKQDENKARRNPRIPSESYEIRFAEMSDEDIYNLIRAQVAPLKGPYLYVGKEKVHFNELLKLPEIADLRIKYS